MKRSPAWAAVLGCCMAMVWLASGEAGGQDRGGQPAPPQAAHAALAGPAIQKLVNGPLSGGDLRKLVTTSSTAREHPDLVDYYGRENQRLLAESKRYEGFARAAGDPKPVSEPDHYGVSRSARFNYLAAKDKLIMAQSANLLAELNAQAARQEGCFTCHSLHGQGGKIAPDLAVEGRRERSQAWLTGHFKDPQAHSRGSVMPSFGGLTDRQLEVLSAFLQYQK